MVKRLITLFMLALACALPSVAAEINAPTGSGQAGPGDVMINNMIRTESQQPMKMNEPMPTGMARKGMKKGDVRAHAMKKKAVMDEMMKQEKVFIIPSSKEMEFR